MFSEAMERSLAPDGGLYVPEKFPQGAAAGLNGSEAIAEIAERVLKPFLAGDRLAADLSEVCRRALNFPIPLEQLDEQTAVLELFHGPTAAFKDVGARFLAECVSRAVPGPSRTVLVATSGDTGGAVAAAFHSRPGIEVVVLYPKGKVSERQEKQLTCWGDNVRAFSVRGDFDDCQRMVKEAFSDPWWQEHKRLISANSINIGRLLPQMIYYAQASLSYLAKTGRPAGFVVPSGNLGNSVAALWARKLGFPISGVMLAANANRAVTEYLRSGSWKPFPTVATLANAMDVGNPSNMERVLNLYPAIEDLRREVRAFSVSDAEIRETIAARRWGRVFCPHTATAVRAREGLPGDWIVVATAHPAKFETIVEPLVGAKVEVPPALQAILSKPSHAVEIGAGLAELQGKIK